MAKANVKVTFLCPIEKVWSTVTDLSNYQWRSDIDNVQIIDEHHFVETSKDGIETKLFIRNTKKFELWEFELENKNMKGQWIGRFYDHGEKTTLDFTEHVVSKKIYLMPLNGSYLRKQQRQYFTDLKKALDCEEASKIQVF